MKNGSCQDPKRKWWFIKDAISIRAKNAKMANENLSSSFFNIHEYFHFVLSVSYVSFGRIDGYSILYDCNEWLLSYYGAKPGVAYSE